MNFRQISLFNGLVPTSTQDVVIIVNTATFTIDKLAFIFNLKIGEINRAIKNKHKISHNLLDCLYLSHMKINSNIVFRFGTSIDNDIFDRIHKVSPYLITFDSHFSMTIDSNNILIIGLSAADDLIALYQSLNALKSYTNNFSLAISEISRSMLNIFDEMTVQLTSKTLSNDLKHRCKRLRKLLPKENLCPCCEEIKYCEEIQSVYCACCEKIIPRDENGQVFACNGCREIYYCNVDCQRHDWCNHKKNCSSRLCTKEYKRVNVNMKTI